MKKVFLIGVCSLLIINLYAATFNSNAIGQKLGVYNNDSEYYLVEKIFDFTTKTQLFRNNILIQTITIERKDDIKTITTDNLEKINIKIYYKNYIKSENEDNLNIKYNYNDNFTQLKSKVVSLDNELQDIYSFYYSNDNKLAGILKVTNDTSVLSTFDISEDYQSLSTSDKSKYKKSQIHNGVINSTQYDKEKLLNEIIVDKNENGQIILAQKTNDRTVKDYYSNSVLNKKEIFDENMQLLKTVEFFYDDNYLKTKEIQTENIYNKFTKNFDTSRKTVSLYLNNKIERVLVSENDILISSYYINENDEKIENLYENNEVYCTITYANDKIVDIQYREASDDL